MGFKPTLEAILTPRDCRTCGRHMDEEFLKAKHEKSKLRYRGQRIDSARKGVETQKNLRQQFLMGDR